jgi:hypothetical protein
LGAALKPLLEDVADAILREVAIGRHGHREGCLMPRFKPTPEKPLPGKPGRKTTFREEIADEIVRRMIEGESLTDICRSKGMPPRVTVYAWFDARPEFYARCARAREALADFLVDEIQGLADTTTEENVQSRKVQISTKQWRAMKLAPRFYSDRAQVEHTGPDGGPIKTQSTVIDPKSLDDEAREALKAVLLAVTKKPDATR